MKTRTCLLANSLKPGWPRSPLCLVLSSLFFAFSAQAAPPDAGSLLNEQRQSGAALPDRLPAGRDKDIERMPMADTGARILIKGFRFSGAEGLATEAELQELVKTNIGKSLSFTELQELVAVVTGYLREKKGYLLARAYLPKQDVTGGIIEIAILAGKVDGKVRIDLKPPHRIDPGRLQCMADTAVAEGSTIRLEDLERAVLLMNDLPGMSTQASLERGDMPGATRIVIHAEEGRLFNGSVMADNYGDRYTGTARATAQLAVNDPLGRGEQFSVSYTGAENLNQGSLAASLPITASGLMANVAATVMHYKLGGDFANLNAKGRTETFSAGLGYPLMRSRNASLWLNLGAEELKMKDESNGATTRDRKVKLVSLGLTGSFYDGYGGGALTSSNLAFYQGDVDLSGLPANAAWDALGPRTAGSFFRALYSLARLQHVTGQLSAFASLRGQFSDGNLDSSQKFILGGPSGVRAYPVGEASGDQGYLLTLEGRYDLNSNVQLVGFADGGCINLNHQVWAGAVNNISGRNQYCLSGAGVGINVGKVGQYSLRASMAHALGNNPGRSLTGQNADNRSDKTRFWMQAVVWF